MAIQRPADARPVAYRFKGFNELVGHEVAEEDAPVILDRYANTSSAGSVIALHKHQDDLASGSLGVLSSFGAGYSIGSVILRKR